MTLTKVLTWIGIVAVLAWTFWQKDVRQQAKLSRKLQEIPATGFPTALATRKPQGASPGE